MMKPNHSKTFLYQVLFTIGHGIVVGLFIEGYLVQGIDRSLIILAWPCLIFLSLLGRPDRPAYIIWCCRYATFGFGLACLARILAGFSPALFYPLALAMMLLALMPLDWLDKWFKPRK